MKKTSKTKAAQDEQNELARKLVANVVAAVRKLNPMTLRALAHEMTAARLKFPNNAHMQAALAKKVGELANVYLTVQPIDRVKFEALQVAVIALRIYEEGDADFGDCR